jgi:hypothetical protein
MKPPRFNVGCVGKFRYASRSAAAEVASRSTNRHDHRIVPFKCSACHGYHVGTSVSRRADNRKPKLYDTGEDGC